MSKNNRVGVGSERREHYKMYKDGKMWAFALIGAIVISGGALATAQPVHADTTTAAATQTTAAATGNVSTEVASDEAPSDETANATMSLSTATVGYDSGATNLTASLKITAPQAGDVYQVNLPANTPVMTFQDGKVPALNADQGTTTVTKNADGTFTIIDTFKASSSGIFTQNFAWILENNYRNQSLISAIGQSTQTITYSVNRVVQAPVNISQTITPTVNLGNVALTYPSGDANTPLQPDTTYVFNYTVNEANGVFDGGYRTARVHSAVNYGTTITIPTPAGFVLDEATSMSLNAFSSGDQTTITQPGGAGAPVIITVLKGSGSQNVDGVPGYRIAGQFNVAATTAKQTLTADGTAHFVQNQNDAGTTQLTADSTTPWQVVIAAAATDGTPAAEDVVKAGQVTATGNSSASSDKLVLDGDTTNDPRYIARFTFANNSTIDLTNATLALTIPDGIDATAVTVPDNVLSAQNYLPLVSEYLYTLTLADGTKQTGTAAPGDIITTHGAAIRAVELTPNLLVAGATFTMTNFNAKDLTPNLLAITGTLSATYDDGTAVAVGDELEFDIALLIDGATVASATTTEAVVTPTTFAHSLASQSSQQPGTTAADQMSLGAIGNANQTTDTVFEPIFYYVVPNAMTVNAVKNVDPAAHVSEFTADDGRTVVEIDYTGTGLYVSMQDTFAQQVVLDNKVDALPGDYYFLMYIYSPVTVLTNKDKVTDTSYTAGNADAYKIDAMYGFDHFTIQTVGVYQTYATAQGDQDATPQQGVPNGDSSKPQGGTQSAYSTDPFTFNVSIVNTAADGQTHDGTLVVNLPEAGDDQGSQYTFQLTGPVTVPANYTTATGEGDPIDATVLYSTSRAVIADKQATFDLTGYMTAEELEAAGIAWSEVKSVVIQVADVASNTTTGSIALTGVAQDAADHLNETGYLQTALAADNSKYGLNNQAAAVTLAGISQITARYHYIDADGNDQYIALDDLTQNLLNGVAKVATLPTTQEELSAYDQRLIPADYVVLPGFTVLAADGSTGTAASGAVSTPEMNGDIIQYELQGQVRATVQYIDDSTGATTAGESLTGVVGDTLQITPVLPSGYVLATTQAAGVTVVAGKISYPITVAGDVVIPIHIVQGTAAMTVTYLDQYDGNKLVRVRIVTGLVGDTGTYTTDVPDHYELADGQAATLAYTLTADGTDNLVVYLAHKIVNTTKTTTRTITYVVNGTATAPEAVEQTIDWAVETDEVINQSVATPTQAYAQVESPTLKGYAPDKSSVAQEFPTPTSDLDQLTDTQEIVTYNLVEADLTVSYVDDVTGKPVTAPATVITQITGHYGDTGTYVVSVPENYGLAEGQAQTVAYTLTDDDTDNIVVHLVHLHTRQQTTTTDTVTYTGLPDALAQAPKSVTINWSGDTDLVEKTTVWTPDTTSTSIASPDVSGYTPSAKVVIFDQAVETLTAGTQPSGQQEKVIYFAQAAALTVHYLDKDDHDAPVTTDLVQGKVDETGTYTPIAPANYELAPDQATSLGYKLTQDETDDLIVYLVHQHTQRQITTTDTVTYTGLPDALAQAPKSATITWQGDTDLVTKETVWTPDATSTSIASPDVPGYTPSAKTADFAQPEVTLTAGTQPQDQTAIVSYDPQAAALTVRYVDDDRGGAPVTTEQVQGKVDETGTYTVAIPAGYALAKGQAATLGYNLTQDETDDLTVHLVHRHTQTTVTTADTVTYTGLPAALAQAPKAETITWQGDTDLVAKTTTWTPNATSTSITSPTVTGYTPEQATVTFDQPTLTTGAPQDQTAKVAYHADPATLTVRYIDDVTGDLVTTDTVTGVTDETGTYTVQVPAHYWLAKGQVATLSYTLAQGNGDDLTVHLTHAISYSTAETTRTITYVVAGDVFTAPAPVVQTLTWKIATDDVTGTVLATPQGQYASVKSPVVPVTETSTVQTAWRPDQAQVAALAPAAITALPQDAAPVVVTYKPYAQVPLTDPWVREEVGAPTFAEQYTVQFVTPAGEVVGTTALVGNAGNKHTVQAPTGYHFADGTTAQQVTLPAGETRVIKLTVFKDAPLTPNDRVTTDTTQPAGTGHTTKQTAAAKKATLPQTGDTSNPLLAVAGLSLLASLLALGGFRKRREER